MNTFDKAVEHLSFFHQTLSSREFIDDEELVNELKNIWNNLYKLYDDEDKILYQDLLPYINLIHEAKDFKIVNWIINKMKTSSNQSNSETLMKINDKQEALKINIEAYKDNLDIITKLYNDLIEIENKKQEQISQIKKIYSKNFIDKLDFINLFLTQVIPYHHYINKPYIIKYILNNVWFKK